MSGTEVKWSGLAGLEWTKRCFDWSVSYKSKWERYCGYLDEINNTWKHRGPLWRGKHCKIIIFWVRNHCTCKKNWIGIFCQTHFTETLLNLVGQHAINLIHFSGVTFGNSKIEKTVPFTSLHQCFYVNTVLYTFLKENVFNYHELRLLVIIHFFLCVWLRGVIKGCD